MDRMWVIADSSLLFGAILLYYDKYLLSTGLLLTGMSMYILGVINEDIYKLKEKSLYNVVWALFIFLLVIVILIMQNIMI